MKFSTNYVCWFLKEIFLTKEKGSEPSLRDRMEFRGRQLAVCSDSEIYFHHLSWNTRYLGLGRRIMISKFELVLNVTPLNLRSYVTLTRRPYVSLEEPSSEPKSPVSLCQCSSHDSSLHLCRTHRNTCRS